MAARRGYEGVAVCVPVTVPYTRFSQKTAHWWTARALGDLVKKAGIMPGEIDGLCLSSFSLAPDTAVGLVQHLGLSPRWLDHIPMGGASGVVALRRAARAVQAGDADIVACVGADTNHVDSFRRLLSSFSRFAQDASYPYGGGGPNAAFALLTDAYMRTYGARREDFGKICVAQRENALSFPHALMKGRLTLDDYMNGRAISDPITLFDCVMPCAGADAFLVMHEKRARDLGLAFAGVLATIERHDAFPSDPVQLRGGWAQDVAPFWDESGIARGAVDVIQTYDDYPVIVMMQFEDLGLCAKGEAKEFVRAHDLTIAGDRPHNTSGGQLSAGQAGAAGGYIGLVEALRQITGQALGGQVKDARRALVSGFGMINYDRGVCSAAALLEQRT